MTKTQLFFTRTAVLALGIGMPLLIIGRFVKSPMAMLYGELMIIPVITVLFILALIGIWKGY